MRLSSIKMSGFKSFVDSTTLLLPTTMIGIVGPNGCGKSNIIDAVRWVMGESSRQIRGDTIEDIIFNGSSTRSPVSQASVELMFDNGDGKLGGEYSAYTEISVRRQVTRDGQSKYFLNGTKCRRRDIVNLFLGTGLGPCSYAIIEQGMISRLIDARPDELRVYLEEASGISKYKERRRETENRIHHTRENLDRLDDVIEEVAKNIERLQRQARAARRYKALKAEERRAKTELLALHWQVQQREVQRRKQSIRRKQTEIEKVMAKIRSIEAEIEELRQQHIQDTEKFNNVQSNYYQSGGEISRVEQSIQHAKELNSRYHEELQRAQQAWAQAERAAQEEQVKAAELEASIIDIQAQLKAARTDLEANARKLHDVEAKMATWQEAWEALTAKTAEPMQTVKIETSRLEYLQAHLQQLASRKDKLLEELHQYSKQKLPTRPQDIASRVEEIGAPLEVISLKVANLTKKISNRRDTAQKLSVWLEQARETLHSTQTRLTSLQALQRVALSEDNRAVSEWLEREGLSKTPRLLNEITIKPGWEIAVETVLNDYLEAVCVRDLRPMANTLHKITTGCLTILDQHRANRSDSATDTLASKVTAPVDLSELLSWVYTATDIDSAFQKRAMLASGQSVITRDGIWIGRNWLRISRVVAGTGNVLQRRGEIQNLEKTIISQRAQIAKVATELKLCQDEIYRYESERDRIQARLTETQKQRAQVEARLARWKSKQEHVQRQQQQLQDYLDDVNRQIRQAEEELNATVTEREQAEAVLKAYSGERQLLLKQRDNTVIQVDAARNVEVERREAAHKLTLNLESCKVSLKATRASLVRIKEQVGQLKQRRESLQASARDGSAPLEELKQRLKKLVDQRLDIEHDLTDARGVVQKNEAIIRTQQESKIQIRREIEKLRSELSELQLSWQEANVRSTTLKEQLGEHDLTPESLIERLPEDATLQRWEQKVQSLGHKITRLGAINLTAIDEHEEHSERQQYLDRQRTDLTNALDVLETAIRKIDKETKDRFKDIFKNVNNRLQETCPRLFGGGKAFLEMTGNDLLTAGVSIMVHPPGKRLTSIQLLSGGEKALTAVALVFSLFALNPAPFCLLDEVDAPLDDANISRYCELLKDMSGQVQFIYITHNKNTMEYANKLLGITMNEPGISRIVSVDVDKAVQMVTVS